MINPAYLLLTAALASAQTGVVKPLVEQCGPQNVLCVNKYASVMPYPFVRNASISGSDIAFDQTSVPNDTSFAQLADSNFVAFDRKRGLNIFGPDPQYDFMFTLASSGHEAPVYVASQNKLYFSQLAPPAGYLPQLAIDLSQDPPTLSEFLSSPPVYAPNGGTFSNGHIIWAASGDNQTFPGGEQRPGLRLLDLSTNTTTTLLNNYYGIFLNGPNDLVVDSRGGILFTDPQYSYLNGLTSALPLLRPATYRFCPRTGQTRVLDDTLAQPNGLTLSPDGRSLYIGDSGAENSVIAEGKRGTTLDQRGPRGVYKFDVRDGGNSVSGRRMIWYTPDGIPDGLKAAANGYLVVAAGRGLDVLDADGSYLARVQTNFTVQNFAWTGQDLDEVWLFGPGAAARVKWALTGIDLARRKGFATDDEPEGLGCEFEVVGEQQDGGCAGEGGYDKGEDEY